MRITSDFKFSKNQIKNGFTLILNGQEIPNDSIRIESHGDLCNLVKALTILQNGDEDGRN